MSRFTLIPLSTALAGCAPLQPDGCEKASAVNDCVYAAYRQQCSNGKATA